jgi:hypothetical protein
MFLENRTHLMAERFTSIDRDAVEHVVVAVKGTYAIEASGATPLSGEQAPILLADQHYGEPGSSSVRFESDCVPPKPRVDVVVVGHACAPHGREVEQLDVELWVGPRRKRVRVIGDRVWHGTGPAARQSRPVAFSRMPLVYERAFGGTDTSPEDPEQHRTDMRNPLGRGFCAYGEGVTGTMLPNIEDPQDLINSWSSRPEPVGFGCVARGASSRIRHAGTYDQKWLDERFPFLPDDFDTRYFQCAPDDQQFPELRAGEVVRCIGMTPDGECQFRVPDESCPIYVVRRRGLDVLAPQLDTLLIEPDERRFSLVWHASVPAGRKLHDILRIVVGPMTSGEQRAHRSSKHYFPSLAALIERRAAVELEAEEL